MKKAFYSLLLLGGLFATFAQTAVIPVSVGTKVINFNKLLKTTVTFSIPTTSAADTSGNVTFPVSIVTSRIPPAGVQFDLAYNSADITSISATAGTVVTAAGKTLTCNLVSAGLYRCLAAGLNTTGIANGVIANVTAIANKPTNVTIQNVVATSSTGGSFTSAISTAVD